jgi:hypothetical protein
MISQSLEIEFKDGIILIGSDAHIWPGVLSTAFKGFIKLAKELNPKIIVLNGDVLDFPQISKHAPIGWSKVPSLKEEIEAGQKALSRIEGKAKKIWTIGNHDVRYDTKLATQAPEFKGVKGTSLSDHFPLWEQTWCLFVNQDVVIKHRYKGGTHATHNNVIWAGRSLITGHVHSQKVTPFDDYNGTRYGVDTGCLADPNHEQFLYTENNPKNWRSGFGVLTFVKGKLLPPELVTVWGKDSIVFRGKVVKL